MNKKLVIFISIIIGFFLLDRHYGWSAYFSVPEHLLFLKQIVRTNFLLALLIYMAATIIACVVLALPGVTFAILAGALFGPWIGTLVCCGAATIGAGLAFTSGRYFLKDSLKPVVMKNDHIRTLLFDDVAKNDLELLMITRLIPLFPYNLQNFAYGITDISFRKYMLYSFLFMLPGTAMYTIGIAGLLSAEHRFLYFGVAALLAAGVVIMSGRLKKKQMDSTGTKHGLDLSTNHKSGCISCGNCTDNCSFLKKYQLDFSKEAELSRLADHCFLCGKCTEVCPNGVDGRDYILEIRRKNVSSRRRIIPRNLIMCLEKADYLFKNYKHGNKKSVLFPGCSYPSHYPETTKKLIQLLEAYGIGVVFDCCGKPIGEMGEKKKEESILTRLNQNLKQRKVEELVTICPNCHEYLTGKMDMKVVSVYDKLRSLGIGNRISEREINYFSPCPDRSQKKWIKQMEPFLPEKARSLESIPCCGLGGCALQKETEIASEWCSKLSEELKGRQTEQIYVYCASCAGTFTRNRIGQVRHLLNEILCSQEKAKVQHSVLNRLKFKWY